MDNQGKSRHLVHMDASVAGPLLMLSAALLFTLLNVFIKLLGPAFTVWHIGFFRFFGGLAVLLSVFGRHGNPYRGFNTRLLIIRGCVGSIGFISFITAIRLLRHELNQHRGKTMVFLIPARCGEMIQTAYQWGAKNCELHVAQVYGQFVPFKGVAMPTFLPETG